jgi:phage-related protein
MTYTLLLEGDEPDAETITPDQIDYELLYRALAYASLEVKLETVKIEDIYKLDLEALSGNLYFSITDPIGQLAEWIAQKMRELAEWFSRTVDRLLDPVRSAISSVLAAVGALPARISEIVSSAADSVVRTVRDVAGTIVSQISLHASEIISRLGDLVRGVAYHLSSMISNLFSAISSVGRTLGDMISSAVSTLTRAIEAVQRVVSTLIDRVIGAITGAVSTVVEWIRKIIDMIRFLSEKLPEAIRGISDAVSRGFETLSNSLKVVVDSITSSLSSAAETISKSITSLASEISSRVVEIISAISASVSDIKNFVELKVAEVLAPLDVQSKILDMIAGMLPTGFRELMEASKILFDTIHTISKMLMDFIYSVVTAPLQPIHEKLDKIIAEIGERVSPFIGPISETVGTILSKVGEIPSFVAEKASEVAAILADKIIALAEVLRELTVYVRQFGGIVLGSIASIEGFVRSIAEFLSRIPEIIVNTFGKIPEFIEWVVSGVRSLGANLVWFIRERVISPLVEAVKVVRDKISDILELGIDLGRMVFSKLADIVGALWSAFLSALSKLIDLSFSAGRFFFSAFTEVGMAAMNYVIELFSKIIEALPKTLDAGLSPVVDRIFLTIGVSSPPDVTRVNLFVALVNSWAMLFYVALSALLTVGLVKFPAFMAKGYAIGMAQYDLTWEIDLHPWGVGITIPFKPFRFLAGILSNFADELMKFADKIYEPFWFGMAFWLSRFFSTMYAYEMRNTIPIRLPTLRELEELWLRARVAERLPPKMGRTVKDALEGYIYYTKLRGYSDFLLEASFADPDKMYFTLKDRFGIVRIIPLARAWRIPTPSVVARMWVRDVLRPTGATAEEMIENLTKVYEATGLYRDIGLLYTLLAFRYPSPRALSEFYWRSMAALNWLKDSMEELEWSRMFNIQWKAIDPYSLNVRKDRAEILNRMMSLYLKWHDLFPSAWDKDFPTDKAIVMEITADLPTRIDLRWLTRWGIFEHLARSGIDVMADLITMFSQVSKLTGHETRETKVTPEITLDVRFLSRFLIGRRINPVVAPLVAVAQIHAVLAPSFTLLRTGFIEALRRGWITLDTAEYLMSGLFVIKFRTGYIDTATGEFKEFEYRKPVFWLPAERRLLQIRGILDRYNWLMRDTLTRVVRALTLVALYPDEAREIFFSIHQPLAEHVRENIKALSGVDWKPEMDIKYIDIWMHYAQTLSIIGARTWVRRHISRTMGWVFFRILTGVIKHEHLERILSVMREIEVNGKKIRLLSDIEIAYYSKLGRELIELVRREAIPSPSTLGTFAEYMVIQESVIRKVLEEYHVPEEFRDMWIQYIKVKPLKSDFRALITTAIRAFRVNVLTREDLEKILDEARQFGFTDIEIELLRRRIELEEAIDEVKGWRPSVSTLITISELIPEASEYIRMLKIDPRFRDLIMRYAAIKPLADEARTLVNTYFRARRYIEIPKDIEGKVREIARLVGITDIEWMMREINLELQMLIDESRQWAPTPSTLATLSEFIALDERVVMQALERRRVTEPWKSIWLKYIEVRPVKSDYKTLINVARRARVLGVIPEERWNQIIKDAELFGFTKREIEIIKQIADLDMAIASSREWAPGVMTMITISELVPEATEILKEMPIKAKFRDLIVEYARRRQIADEVRRLLSSFQRMKRLATLLGQKIPSEIEAAVEAYSKMIGLTEDEKRIRDLVSEIEIIMDQWLRGEVIPTLSTLLSMAEYIEIPEDYLSEILTRRRVEKRFAEMWLRFMQARSISTEVGRVVSAYTSLVTRFSVPKSLEEQVKELMRRGGWTRAEVEIFDLEIAIRRYFRILSTLVPTLRQAISDSLYMPDPGRIIEDTLSAYGITLSEYARQIEYYKRLAKNRRIWRHFAWYRSQLVAAFARGIIDERTLRAKLERFKAMGLLDDDEIEIIVDGAKLRALARG